VGSKVGPEVFGEEIIRNRTDRWMDYFPCFAGPVRMILEMEK
jgi:hypothetical protein